jgi:hypothetical protein
MAIVMVDPIVALGPSPWGVVGPDGAPIAGLLP